MSNKPPSELSDAELRSELTRRAKARADEEIQAGKEQFDALEGKAEELIKKLVHIWDDVSEEIKEDLADHIKGLPNLKNVTKGTSLLKMQTKVPPKKKTRRTWTEAKKKEIIKELEDGSPAAQLALKHNCSTSQVYSWWDEYKTKE